MPHLPTAYSINFRSFAVLFVTTLLVACGGGGGGGNSSEQGNGSTLQFPDVPSPVLSDISSTSLVVMNRASSRNMTGLLLNFFEINDSLFNDVRTSNNASTENDNQIKTVTYPCDSGSITQTYRIAQDGTGHLVLQYSNCFDKPSSYTRNGYEVIDVQRVDSIGTPQDFKVTLSQYTLSGNDLGSMSIDGTLDATTANALATTKLNLELKVLNGTERAQAKDLILISDPTSISYSYMPGARSGTIYDSTQGRATLDSTSTTRYIKLIGSNNTSVNIDMSLGSNDLSLQLDSDGDGIVDAYAAGVTSDKLIQDGTTNTPPVLSNITSSYNGPYPFSASLLLGNPIYDADTDYLSYQWSVTSAPSGTTYHLNASDHTDVTFDSSYPGDYIVRLTVTDNGGPNFKEIHIHIQAAAPNVNLPTTVSATSLNTLNLQLSPTSSIDGPYTFQKINGPSGLTVDSQGLLSFTPGHNPVLSETVYDSVIRISNADTHVDVKIPVRVYDASKTDPIVRTNPRFNVAIAGAGDFDGSSTQQILLADVSTLKWDGTNYVQNWAQPFAYNAGLGAPHVAVGDIDNDTQTEMVEASNTDQHLLVTVYKNGKEIKQRTIALETHYSYTYGAEVFVAIADIDNDGAKEIVLLTEESQYINNDEQKLIVLDANTLNTKWIMGGFISRFGLARTDLRLSIANVDNDPALEIILAQGLIIDGNTHQIESQYSTSLGALVCTADFDGNGIKRIVTRDSNGFMYVYDAIQKQAIKTFNSSDFPFSLITCADTDNNGRDEIVVNSLVNGTNHNAISLYNLTSNQPIRQINVPTLFYGTGSMLAYDLDSDGYPELIEKAYGTADYLSVNSFADGSNRWNSSNIANLSNFNGAYDYQTNSSSHTAFFWGSDIGQPTVTSTVNLVNGNVATNNIGATLNSGIAYTDVQLSDYDHDGRSDLFLLRSGGYGSFRLDVADQETGTLKRSYTPPPAINNIQLLLGDVTGDNQADAIFGDSPLYVYDVNAGALSNSINASFQRGTVGDLDGDGVNELVTAVNYQLSIYKKISGNYQLTSTYTYEDHSVQPSSILIADIDNDGTPEIVLTTGNIVHLLNNQGSRIRSTTINGVILGAAADRFTTGNLLLAVQSQSSDLMATTENASINYILSMNPFTGQNNWRSAALRGTPSANSMHYGPDVSPGHPRLLLGTSAAMYIFQ